MDSGCEKAPAVLFVSSIPERRNSLTESAERLGLVILSASRCREARLILRNHSAVEVVVVDVTLPDGNWCEILRWIIEQQLAARVILVSPVSDAAMWSEAVWRGAYDVLVEPFSAWEFSRSIEGALRNRLHYEGAPPRLAAPYVLPAVSPA